MPNDILTRLLTEEDAQGAKLSDEDLQDNLLALLFAGEDLRRGDLIRCFLRWTPPEHNLLGLLFEGEEVRGGELLRCFSDKPQEGADLRARSLSFDQAW